MKGTLSGVPLSEDSIQRAGQMTTRLFDARRKKGYQNVEVHLTREELTTVLAIAISVGKAIRKE